ncbi:hypothetical protein B0H16DRAFT_1881966 [Mycena metata]|uniref:Novel STAND NTPase 1 domain-containing protein n=1 Tax=Mycena metata TaxID=1033252 RepID=A0AAD7JTX2_9AGAR|nr:hypothetical protein B0H16DRAFT_1881966 [Mycena metata]
MTTRMQPRLKDLIEYTSFAASTIKQLSRQAQAPYLLQVAALTSIILEFAKVYKIKEQMFQMIEQVHEILCAIISLYSGMSMGRSLPPALLAKFTETLQKIYTLMKQQRDAGKIKQLFKYSDTASQLNACAVYLQDAAAAFRVQTGISTLHSMGEIQKSAQQQHEALIALLAAHPDMDSTDFSSVGTRSSLGNSSDSFTMFPPSPKLFHGRETELTQIMDILTQDSARVVILGPGGMGKTSLALTALYHPNTVARYIHRHFVPCHAIPGCSELVAHVALHIGAPPGPNLSRKVVRHFSANSPSLLILDNFETPWESVSARADVEEFLSLLADVPHLALLLTMRGAERPGKVKWTRPCPVPLLPLTPAAALQTFMDVADDSHDKAAVQQLLDLTGNLPLAISLIANVAAHEGCPTALSRWRTESTRMVSDGHSKTSSLEISIVLSLSSARMTSEAHELLSILSMLPDGLSDVDLAQSALPIPNILTCKSTLMRTSLAYNDHDQRLKVLVPIREYVYNVYPPASELKLSIRSYFHKTLELWDQYKHAAPTGISGNLGNFNQVFLDAMQTDYPDMETSLRSILLLNMLSRQRIRAPSPVMEHLRQKIVLWQDAPVYGDYLIESLHSLGYFGLTDKTRDIELGNRFFESRGELPRARWHNALGQYYFIQNNHEKALYHRRAAVSLAETLETATLISRHALQGIAQILRAQGNYVKAKLYAKKAQDCTYSLGDIFSEGPLIALQANCCLSLGDFRQAAQLCVEARQLLKACGLEGGVDDVSAQIYQAEIHMLRTEYSEARAINVFLTSLGAIPTFQTAYAYLNIALIDAAIAADPDLIRANADIAQEQLTVSLAWPMGTHLCNIVYADLHLRRGDLAQAESLYAASFRAMQGKADEGAIMCLERLADPDNCMCGVEATLQWAVVFLVSASQTNNRLALMKALRCLGDFSKIQGDEETALQLFEVALDGFTLMDYPGQLGEL